MIKMLDKVLSKLPSVRSAMQAWAIFKLVRKIAGHKDGEASKATGTRLGWRTVLLASRHMSRT